jgi:hypothetical protein
MDNNDMFSMATIFTQLNDDEFKRIFLLSGLLNTTLLEYLNIILLHSLHINTQLSNEDKQQIERRYNQLYKLFIAEEPPNIPYSFIDTLDVINKIIQINKNTYYIFMHLMIENDNDETFKNEFIQSLMDNYITIIKNQLKVSFSNKYPLIYNTAKATYLQSSTQTEEEQIEANIIEDNYNKTKLGQFYKLNEDFNNIIDKVINIQTYNQPDLIEIEKDDFLIKYPFFFKINTPNWKRYFRRYNVSDEVYFKHFRYINYFIRMTGDNMQLMSYCNTLLDKYGPNICNLKYLDYYNVTPLMYACGYSIENLNEYINGPIINENTDENNEDNDDNDDNHDDNDDNDEHERGVTFTFINQSVDYIYERLIMQIEPTTPDQIEAHQERIRPLKKLLNERGKSWDRWYNNNDLDITYKDEMINLFYLIDTLNDEYNGRNYDTLQIASDMMMYELLELIKYPNTNSGIDFKFHYRIDPDNRHKIDTIGVTYIMNEEETNQRLDKLNITNKDEWSVYKCCILLTKANDDDDLYMLRLAMEDIFKNDNKKYKLICAVYDPDNTSYDYGNLIKDVLEFYHDDIDSTDSIIANFAGDFNQVFSIYKKGVGSYNFRIDYDEFFNIDDEINALEDYDNDDDDNDEEQLGGSEPQQSQLREEQLNPQDDDRLPTVIPQLIRSEGVIQQHQLPEYQLLHNRSDDDQSRQTAGATTEELIKFQELALNMLSYGADVCNLTQQNDSGFTAYNYAVKHRLLDIVYQMDKLLYTNTSLYDTIKPINVNNNQEINDYIYGDDININDINQYFTENTDKVVFKYSDNYTIIHLDQIKPNIIDAKRYTCNETSNDMYRPPDKMIDRINPIFHTEKIGNIPIGGGVLLKDILSIDTNMSRFYELEDTNNSYISFVSSVLVDSATTESAVSMTHCNPGATGKIYRLIPIQPNIISGGSSKIKYRRRLSKKRSSKSKRKLSRRKSSHRKSAKRK